MKPDDAVDPRAAFGRLVVDLGDAVGRLTELVEVTRGLSLNHVLTTTVLTLDGDGVATIDFDVPFAALQITNHSPMPLTVTPSPAQGRQVPALGPASFKVGPGRAALRPLAGNVVSCYGRPATQVGVTAYLTPMPPSEGQIAGRAVRAVPIPGVSGLLAVNGGLGGVGYQGFTVRETTGAATAIMRVRDGSVTGTILEDVSLLAGQSAGDYYGPDGEDTTGDIYVELFAGAVEGSIRVS